MKKRGLFLAAIWALATTGAMAAGKAKINAPAPDFKLQGHDGKTYQLSDLKGKYVVMEWWNKDCPFVRKHYDSKNMQKLQKTYTSQKVNGKEVVWLTMLSSAPEKQGYLKADGIKKVMGKEGGSPTAVLMDPKGKAGRLYEAKTTPHMYIVDPDGKLVYRGAIDDNSSADPDDVKSAKNYVTNAFASLSSGKKVDPNSTKPYGCSVKY